MGILILVYENKPIFIFYNITNLYNNQRGYPFMALYNMRTSAYSQHVSLKHEIYDYMSITRNNLLFQGFDNNSLIMVQYPDRILESNPAENIKEDANPVLIKYRVSDAEK